MGQEECPLLFTENLPLFRIDSKRIKKDQSHWKQGHSDSILLLISSERIDWTERNMESAGIDWSRFDAEEAVRGLNEEEREKRLGKISMIMELQGKINELKITFEMIKRQKEAETIRQRGERRKEEKWRERDDNNNNRVCKESYQKNEKEREERKEQERVNKEWRRQEMQERRREEKKQIAMEERKCFACREFGHMAYSYRNVGKEGPTQMPSNRFEVLKVRVM